MLFKSNLITFHKFRLSFPKFNQIFTNLINFTQQNLCYGMWLYLQLNDTGLYINTCAGVTAGT